MHSLAGFLHFLLYIEVMYNIFPESPHLYKERYICLGKSVKKTYCPPAKPLPPADPTAQRWLLGVIDKWNYWEVIVAKATLTSAVLLSRCGNEYLGARKHLALRRNPPFIFCRSPAQLNIQFCTKEQRLFSLGTCCAAAPFFAGYIFMRSCSYKIHWKDLLWCPIVSWVS